MVEFPFADDLKKACRHCATFARANAQRIYEHGLVPRPEDETATVSFVRFEGHTYAVTALHVIDGFYLQAEQERGVPECYFLPAGKGLVVQPPFIPAPQNFPQPPPDMALSEINAAFPEHIGKEAFEFRPSIKPTYPVRYAAAVGFPSASKANRPEPLGNRLAMQCVHAVAEGVGGPEEADQLQFYSEIASSPETGSLSGMSGGPVFWSDGETLGLLGFVKEALDVLPRPGEETIYSGPRVNFIVQHVTYETFARWVSHALHEQPRRREELNRLAEGGSR